MLEALSEALEVVSGLPKVAQVAVGFAIAVFILGLTAAVVIRAAAKYRRSGHAPAPKKVVRAAPASPSEASAPPTKTRQGFRVRLLALVAIVLGLR